MCHRREIEKGSEICFHTKWFFSVLTCKLLNQQHDNRYYLMSVSLMETSPTIASHLLSIFGSERQPQMSEYFFFTVY